VVLWWVGSGSQGKASVWKRSCSEERKPGLLDAGHPVDKRNVLLASSLHLLLDDGFTSLHLACVKGHEVVVSLFLERGTAVDARDTVCVSPSLPPLTICSQGYGWNPLNTSHNPRIHCLHHCWSLLSLEKIRFSPYESNVLFTSFFEILKRQQAFIKMICKETNRLCISRCLGPASRGGISSCHLILVHCFLQS
jgi:hypothetical protein